MNDSTVISFGELTLTGPDVLRWTTRNALNEIPSATVSLNGQSPLLHALALNEQVVIEGNGHCVFTGTTVSARVEGDALVVHCSGAPQMETQRASGVVARASHTQLVRLIVLDAETKLPAADDTNEICPAATVCLDWDSFLADLQRAPDFLSFTSVVQEYIPDADPSDSEKRLLSQILGLVTKEIASNGMADAPAGSVLRQHYEASFPSMWGCSWRHRRQPDEHEVTVPLRQVAATAKPIDVAHVEFVEADPNGDEYLGQGAGEDLKAEWSAGAYARTVVRATDLWTAKALGLVRIREAMAAVAFAYTYTPWHQKVGEGDYVPVPFARPAGAPGVLGPLVRVVNLKSSEYWVGSITSRTDPCDLTQLQSLRGALLAQADLSEQDSELLRHVRRALSWRYRAELATMPVDAFLYMWVSLEMLFQRSSENTSDLIRRLPFATLSVGDKTGSIRSELQKRWIPLRDEIVHRAVEDHPEIDAAVRRVRYFSDCAIGYALARAEDLPAYDDWLDYLDALSRSKPSKG